MLVQLRAHYSAQILAGVHALFYRDDSLAAWAAMLRRLASTAGP